MTTLAADPASNTAGWNNTAVNVSLTATDDSAVTSTSYRLDGGSPQDYSDAVNVATAGTHTFEYWSVDLAHKTEVHKTAAIKIDLTAPSLPTLQVLPAHHSASINASATDALSGVDYIEMKIDDGVWAKTSTITTNTLGSHTAYARAFD